MIDGLSYYERYLLENVCHKLIGIKNLSGSSAYPMALFLEDKNQDYHLNLALAIVFKFGYEKFRHLYFDSLESINLPSSQQSIQLSQTSSVQSQSSQQATLSFIDYDEPQLEYNVMVYADNELDSESDMDVTGEVRLSTGNEPIYADRIESGISKTDLLCVKVDETLPR